MLNQAIKNKICFVKNIVGSRDLLPDSLCRKAFLPFFHIRNFEKARPVGFWAPFFWTIMFCSLGNLITKLSTNSSQVTGN